MILVGWVVLGLAVALLLAPRLAAAWVGLRDRASRNSHGKLLLAQQLPRYFTRDQSGKPDVSARWPGWDAWTATAIPANAALAPQMIRGTLMTGMFGLEGIDNYEKLLYRLSPYQAVEHLALIPTTYQLPDGEKLVLGNLSQNYLTRQTDLRMDAEELDVTILGSRTGNFATEEPFGHIEGAWPHYRLFFRNPEAEVHVSLKYVGEHIVWWTDLPGWYSHFSAFGNFEVVIEYARGTTVADIHRPLRNPCELRFQARGTVEHLSSREPFAYDWLWLPLRYIGRAFPSLRPILYHHEVIIAPGLEGGFIHARAFGADFRNGGGLFDGSHFHAVKRVRVSYGTAEPVDNCGGIGKPTPAYRTWDVHASTAEGELVYIATRTHPPAMVASNSNQYHFTFQGNWRGEPVTGHGYGEYIHL
jgi:hypothetical protein